MQSMMTLPPNDFKPAKGLQLLTWPQVEKIDALVASLCAYAHQRRGRESLLLPFFIEINQNGLPTKISGEPLPISIMQPILREVLKPGR